mgnify:CR=1 FL=1
MRNHACMRGEQGPGLPLKCHPQLTSVIICPWLSAGKLKHAKLAGWKRWQCRQRGQPWRRRKPHCNLMSRMGNQAACTLGPGDESNEKLRCLRCLAAAALPQQT